MRYGNEDQALIDLEGIGIFSPTIFGKDGLITIITTISTFLIRKSIIARLKA